MTSIAIRNSSNFDVMSTPRRDRLFSVFSVVNQEGRHSFITYFEHSASKTSEPDLVNEIMTFLDRSYPAARVEMNLAESLNDAGISNVATILSWCELRKELNEEYLRKLQATGFSLATVRIAANQLDVDKNKGDLQQLAVQQYAPGEYEMIEVALGTAVKAHARVAAAREQDIEGLFHIPYVNHPICVALNCIRINLSAQAVQAALLHDVVEDTLWTLSDLEKRFDPEVIRLVDQLSKHEGQGREEFLADVRKLTGEAATIKALDRFDNMFRALAIPDKDYLARVIQENQEVYARFFFEIPELTSFYPAFTTVHEEIKALINL